MNLKSGSRLGPYEIIAPLGKGGMGEVYRARDSRLGRIVAVKVVQKEFLENPEFHRRFEREAHAASNLNHPNICTIHDVGSQDGIAYLVMELLEGKTLQDHLKRGALPLTEALDLAVQIAGALAFAHDHGLVHRDLKPGNIMLTGNGAKLLDFGLVKMVDRPVSEAGSTAPTKPLTLAPTGTNRILGTPGYMSPEQARGLQVNKQTDVFSFGCLLFEMLSGTCPFPGSTPNDAVAAVLNKEPDWNQIPSNTPVEVLLVLHHCLRKEQGKRLHDMADARIGIASALEDKLPFPDHQTSEKMPRRPVLGLLAVTLLLGGVALGRLIIPPPPPPAKPLAVRVQVPLAQGTSLSYWGNPVVAVSPDGGTIAYVAVQEEKGISNRLFIQNLSRDEPIQVPGSEPVYGPFFSPDGQWIGFAEGTLSAAGNIPPRLRKVSVDGQSVQTLCSINGFQGGTWSTDGTIYWIDSVAGAVARVSEDGGTSEPVTVDHTGPIFYPWALPDSRHLLVSTVNKGRSVEIAVLDTKTGRLKTLFAEGFQSAYSQGHLVYLDLNGGLKAVAFDPVTQELLGGPLDLHTAKIAWCSPAGGAFSVSAGGTLVYVDGFLKGSGREPSTVARVFRDGRIDRVLLESTTEGMSSVSSDEKYVALATGSKRGVTVFDVQRKTNLKLPGDNFPLWSLLWSPHGDALIYATLAEGGGSDIAIQPVDGHSPPRILEMKGSETPYDWYEDKLLASSSDSLLLVDIETGETRGLPLMGIARTTRGPRLSPDGRWIAFSSHETGDWEVYIQRFPPDGIKYPVSTGGGVQATWGHDGKRIYYLRESAIHEVPLETEPVPRFGEPRILFKDPDMHEFRVTADGKGFIVMKRVNEEAGIHTELNLVLNCLEEGGSR